MNQALAFAEIFGGGIIAYAGYKGVSISEVVQGKAVAPPAALGSSSTPTAGAGAGTEGSVGGEGTPTSGANAPSPASVGAGVNANLLPGYTPAEIKKAKANLEAQLAGKQLAGISGSNHPPIK